MHSTDSALAKEGKQLSVDLGNFWIPNFITMSIFFVVGGASGSGFVLAWKDGTHSTMASYQTTIFASVKLAHAH